MARDVSLRAASSSDCHVWVSGAWFATTGKWREIPALWLLVSWRDVGWCVLTRAPFARLVVGSTEIPSQLLRRLKFDIQIGLGFFV